MSISSVGIPYYMTCKDHDERVQSSVDLCKWNFEMVFRTCPRATKIASAVDFFYFVMLFIASKKVTKCCLLTPLTTTTDD